MEKIKIDNKKVEDKEGNKLMLYFTIAIVVIGFIAVILGTYFIKPKPVNYILPGITPTISGSTSAIGATGPTGSEVKVTEEVTPEVTFTPIKIATPTPTLQTE